MDHEVYLALIELNEKIDFIAEKLMEKGIIPKPKEDKNGKKKTT